MNFSGEIGLVWHVKCMLNTVKNDESRKSSPGAGDGRIQSATEGGNMQVKIINNQGMEWDFPTISAARPYIRKSQLGNFRIENAVRVYDDRNRECGHGESSVFSDEYGDLL
jgi:hypothetical protein